MYAKTTVEAALELAARGLNATDVAQTLGLPRETVRDWIGGALPSSCREPSPCSHDFFALTESYVYLLGLYLGDGCLSAHRRHVYKLRIVLDTRYPHIIASAATAMAEVKDGPAAIQPRRNQNCADVQAYWKCWPCLFPQHGPGKKHERPIVLAQWQQELVERWPEQLLRGLIHSDGCRFQNTGRCNWSWPRYMFTNFSADIRSIFCATCDLVGVRWTTSGPVKIYVSRKADVALLDTFIGPKC